MAVPYALVVSGLLSTLPGSVADGPPQHIVGGQEAQACEWPAAVSTRGEMGDHICTGSLIHPRLVLLAAHCLVLTQAGITEVVFGEHSFAPKVKVPVEGCLVHPSFSTEGNLFDLALCQLADEAPPVPIVPILAGCEAEQLSEGAEVTLVGYGMDNDQTMSGSGTKRWTVNTVQAVDGDKNDLLVVGIDDASACFGDSGGPAYLQLEDGSWRVVGVTSTVHPDAAGTDDRCGTGAVYDLIHTQIEWLEQTAGIDLTPCHDADGTWNPDEACDSFPLSLTDPAAAWMSACQTTELSGPSATCGDPLGAGSTGSSTGATTSGSSSGGTAASDETAGLEAGTATGTSTAGGGESGGDGCGCGLVGPRFGRGGSWMWCAVVLLAVPRRRRSLGLSRRRSRSRPRSNRRRRPGRPVPARDRSAA